MPEASANVLNAHEWAYGLTEVAHIVSLGVAIGLIAVVDLRPDTTATATSAVVNCARVFRDRTRCHAATNAIATPMVMCAVSVAEAIPGPPIGARSRPVVTAPESIDTAHALASHHGPPI